jgi:hypothetical protein
MGQRIPLEIHHVDGNPDNETKENLQILCPNCHAQTDTYKGKNMGRYDVTERKKRAAKYPLCRSINIEIARDEREEHDIKEQEQDQEQHQEQVF